MTFITFSLLLGGAAAAIIPVLLHLMMRGKPKRIEFPALMFVKKNLHVQRRSHRLRQLILLALRMLILLLFGMLLARPTLKLTDGFFGLSGNTAKAAPKNAMADQNGLAGGLAGSLASREAPIAAAIVVDSSLRMEYISENKTRLDQAKEFARWILAQLPQGSEIVVLSSERESAVFQVDNLAAGDKIDRMRITPISRPIGEATADALTLLAGSTISQRELYLITDLSEPGWPAELADSLRNRIEGMTSSTDSLIGEAKELGLFVVDVGIETPIDSALLQLTLSPQTATAQSAISLEVDVYHLGTAATKTIDLLLADPTKPDEAETIRDTKTIDFSEGESRRQVVFSLTGFDSGTRQGRIRFSVHDSLWADDELAFTINIQPTWKVFLAAQPPVRDSSLFLRQALETVSFEIETGTLDELPGKTLNELQKYKALFLLDPGPFDAITWKKLADYASTGGGVGIFLGPSVESLASFNDPSATELLGVKLVRQARVPDGDLSLYPQNEATPILSAFKPFGPLKEFPWQAQPVFRYWETGDLAQRAEVAIPFSDGRAAVISQHLGRGRVAVVTTPVSESAGVSDPWNQWTRGEASWLFVLLAEGIAKYLIGEAERNFNFLAGAPIVIRPDLSDPMAAMPASCLLGTPSGGSIRLTPDVQLREIHVSQATEPGNYRIRSGGAQASLDTGFSVNISGSEMILRRIDKTRLDRLFGETNYHLVRTPREIEQGIARRRIGQELYAFVLLLLIPIFLAEYVFSNRFYVMKETSLVANSSSGTDHGIPL